MDYHTSRYQNSIASDICILGSISCLENYQIEGEYMANNFTQLWTMSFSWIGSILKMKLPIYLGGVSLSTMDILIGTIGIFVAWASIRALLKSGFSIAGKDIVNEYHHQQNIRALNEKTHQEYLNRRSANYVRNVSSTWNTGEQGRLK
jgi:hypothetical protein